jgi:hypothetical protein
MLPASVTLDPIGGKNSHFDPARSSHYLDPADETNLFQ